MEDTLGGGEEGVRRDRAGALLLPSGEPGLSFATVLLVSTLLTCVVPSPSFRSTFAISRPTCAQFTSAASRAARLVSLSCIFRAYSNCLCLRIWRRGFEIPGFADEFLLSVSLLPA